MDKTHPIRFVREAGSGERALTVEQGNCRPIDTPAKLAALVEGLTESAAGLKIVDSKTLAAAQDFAQVGRNIVKAAEIVYGPLKLKTREPFDEICRQENVLLGKVAAVIDRLSLEADAYCRKPIPAAAKKLARARKK